MASKLDDLNRQIVKCRRCHRLVHWRRISPVQKRVDRSKVVTREGRKPRVAKRYTLTNSTDEGFIPLRAWKRNPIACVFAVGKDVR